jgi:hypothetical protein
MRFTTQHYIPYASFLAEFAFVVITSIFVYHQNIGLYDVQGRQEIQNAASGIDIRIFYIADALYHEQPFLLAVNGLMVFIAFDCLVTPYSDIQITVFRRLTEEFDVTAVKEVVATAYENAGRFRLLAVGC